MSVPLPTAAIAQTQQLQQAQPIKPELQPKDGASKFDQMMVDKADASLASRPAAKVQASELIQALQKTQGINAPQKSGRPDSVRMTGAEGLDPVSGKDAASKTKSVITQMLEGVESRNVSMGDFINKAMSGKLKLNQQQLLGLQARVSEYSLELDMTGKVVEKATNGLKDTLRTQV